MRDGRDRRVRNRYRAVPARTSVELDHRPVYLDCGLLSRDLGQCVQPDGAPRRLAPARQRHNAAGFVLWARDESAGPALWVRRRGTVAQTNPDHPDIRGLYHDFWFL